MSLYARCILPSLLDLAMRNAEATRFRQQLVPGASGAVLEIGVGSGRNLPFYASRVDRVVAIDPSPDLLRMARKRLESARVPIDLVEASAELLPLETASIDTAVMTFTLCSIADPARALGEIRRVLKRSGELRFAEHGLSPDAAVRRWQHRFNPMWRRIAGGCNLDRKMDDLIASSGFHLVELHAEYAKGPRPMAYVYCGRAQPR
jgi:ubiquinone/menaquinone biosynthesis C-methylase UbiE